MRTLNRMFLMTVVALTIVVGFGVLMAAQSQPAVRALPGSDSSNFRDLTQITKANVGQLEVAWHYPYAARDLQPGLRP